jgi:hypothetical protein
LIEVRKLLHLCRLCRGCKLRAECWGSGKKAIFEIDGGLAGANKKNTTINRNNFAREGEKCIKTVRTRMSKHNKELVKLTAS